jgi:hypothetical protein
MILYQERAFCQGTYRFPGDKLPNFKKQRRGVYPSGGAACGIAAECKEARNNLHRGILENYEKSKAGCALNIGYASATWVMLVLD